MLAVCFEFVPRWSNQRWIFCWSELTCLLAWFLVAQNGSSQSVDIAGNWELGAEVAANQVNDSRSPGYVGIAGKWLAEFKFPIGFLGAGEFPGHGMLFWVFKTFQSWLFISSCEIIWVLKF